jgi:acyl-coenzyme A thioesterase 13
VTAAEHEALVRERLAMLARGGLDQSMGLRAISWKDGEGVVELEVTTSVQNINGALHGGATAALVDHAGTLAIVATDRQARPGVTTDLNVSYMAPAPGGSTVVATARVLKIGKTMAYVSVDIVRKHDGILVAQGRMSKFQG